jgi:hypothetical protein
LIGHHFLFSFRRIIALFRAERFLGPNPALSCPEGTDKRAKSQAFEVPIRETIICQKKKP